MIPTYLLCCPESEISFLLGASCQVWDCLSSTIGADVTIIQRIAQPKNSVKLQFPSSAISQFLAEASNDRRT
jgi:hypothetical protein